MLHNLKSHIKLNKHFAITDYKEYIPLMKNLLSLCEEALELIQTSKNINLNFEKLDEEFLNCYLKN